MSIPPTGFALHLTVMGTVAASLAVTSWITPDEQRREANRAGSFQERTEVHRGSPHRRLDTAAWPMALRDRMSASTGADAAVGAEARPRSAAPVTAMAAR